MDVVRTLLKHPDIDVNKRSHVQMHAVNNNFRSLFINNIILQDIGHTSLMVACSGGHTECVELLLSKHADPNIRSYVGILF